MPKNSDLKAVPVGDEEWQRRRKAERMAESNTVQKQRAAYTLKRHELGAAVDEFLAKLDEHCLQVAFEFGEAFKEPVLTDKLIQEFTFRLHPYLGVLKEKLDNWGFYNFDDNRYARDEEGKPRTIETPEGDTLDVVGEPEVDLDELTVGLEKWSYIIGVFMGAKLAGASREKLETLKQILII